tara:strand:- start:584 stop:796 length:213 start_codon:yes stop_codon:yes gene_type:complete
MKEAVKAVLKDNKDDLINFICDEETKDMVVDFINEEVDIPLLKEKHEEVVFEKIYDIFTKVLAMKLEKVS